MNIKKVSTTNNTTHRYDYRPYGNDSRILSIHLTFKNGSFDHGTLPGIFHDPDFPKTRTEWELITFIGNEIKRIEEEQRAIKQLQKEAEEKDA
jgi:hypothetical protein